jgi:hypothetical protein
MGRWWHDSGYEKTDRGIRRTSRARTLRSAVGACAPWRVVAACPTAGRGSPRSRRSAVRRARSSRVHLKRQLAVVARSDSWISAWRSVRSSGVVRVPAGGTEASPPKPVLSFTAPGCGGHGRVSQASRTGEPHRDDRRPGQRSVGSPGTDASGLGLSQQHRMWTK